MKLSPIIATVGFLATLFVSTAALASPVGVWLVEDQSGKVRVKYCGHALCGYVYVPNAKEGDEILVSMAPAGKNLWQGRIYDPKDRNMYDGKISMKGEEQLLVTGCSLGTSACGTQTWTRVK